MSAYQQDSNALSLQRSAYEAAAHEASALNLFLEGEVTEDQYMRAMEATEIAVHAALAGGVSFKDLPAV